MPSPRLSDRTLAAARAELPRYDRRTTTSSIVHLGLGAFARAHLAVYVDDLLARGHHDLAIRGVSLRSTDVADALGPQDGLYTLGVVQHDDITARVIGSVHGVLHAGSQPADVRAALASATTTVITVTVTEKGYCWDPATRALDEDHADVVHDVTHSEHPRSMPGHLVRAAADRRAAGIEGMTVLSLDNLPSNGATLARVTAQLAATIDPSLVAWIDDHVRFPCSVIDRIVPATDPGFRQRVSRQLGVVDAWPVRTEAWSQWVVEREWAADVPPLDEVGVIVVGDVAPWERLKLRVLNALHTTAALHGMAHGLETVDAVVADPAGRDLLGRVAAEIVEVLEPPDGVDDLDRYVESTLARFADRGLGHRCTQIAADTSQKLPPRLLDTVRARLDRGWSVDALAEVLALFAWSTLGRDHLGGPRPIEDPMASTLADLAAVHGEDPAALAQALLELRPIFGDLAGNRQLVVAVTSHLGSMVPPRRPRRSS